MVWDPDNTSCILESQGISLCTFLGFTSFFQEQHLIVSPLGPSEIPHWARSAEEIKIAFCSLGFQHAGFI